MLVKSRECFFTILSLFVQISRYSGFAAQRGQEYGTLAPSFLSDLTDIRPNSMLIGGMVTDGNTVTLRELIINTCQNILRKLAGK